MSFRKGKPERTRKLVLHIGMHKTGSTAIQASMSKSRTHLLTKGVNYLSGVRMNHSTTFVSMFCDDPHKYHINVQDGFNTPEKAKKNNKNLARVVLKELKENESDVFVVSGEGLSILPEQGVCALKEFLQPYFDEMKVVCYVRRPIEFYRSMCQQYIVGGRPESDLKREPPTPDYEFRIKKYVKRFGADNVFVRLYDGGHLKNGNVVDDFLSFLGLNESDLSDVDKESTNESLSDTGVQVINFMNERIPMFLNNSVNPERGRFIRSAFLRAAARSSDGKFDIPVYYDESCISEINKDLRYVNAFLSEDQKIKPICGEDLEPVSAVNRDLNPVYLAELVNELQLVAERRRVRINNLERKLGALKFTGALWKRFGK